MIGSHRLPQTPRSTSRSVTVDQLLNQTTASPTGSAGCVRGHQRALAILFDAFVRAGSSWGVSVDRTVSSSGWRSPVHPPERRVSKSSVERLPPGFIAADGSHETSSARDHVVPWPLRVVPSGVQTICFGAFLLRLSVPASRTVRQRERPAVGRVWRRFMPEQVEPPQGGKPAQSPLWKKIIKVAQTCSPFVPYVRLVVCVVLDVISDHSDDNPGHPPS